MHLVCLPPESEAGRRYRVTRTFCPSRTMHCWCETSSIGEPEYPVEIVRLKMVAVTLPDELSTVSGL